MSSSPTVTLEHLREFLLKHSIRDRFYIEYDGFLSNHLSHAAVALFRLGDSREHFERYLVQEYAAKKLEPTDGPARKKQGDAADVEDVQEILGKRTGYYKLLDHYTDLYENKHGRSIESLIKDVFPNLAPGLICSAVHPLIHVGYALSVGVDETVLEGLAYLHHSYRPPILSSAPDLSGLGKGNADITEVLKKLREDRPLTEFMVKRGAEIRAELNEPRNLFQTPAMALLERGDLFAELVLSIKVPKEALEGGVEAISLWALDQAILVYQAAEETNDFFLLHGVTSAWSLTKIVPLLRAEDAAAAIFYYLNALLVVYVVRKSSKLDLKRLEEDEESRHLSWADVRARALALDVTTTDEHVFKLIQVCLERKDGDSLVPGMGAICKRAALTAMSKGFFEPPRKEW